MRDPHLFHYTNQGGEPKVSNFILLFTIFYIIYSDKYTRMHFYEVKKIIVLMKSTACTIVKTKIVHNLEFSNFDLLKNV